MHRALTTGQSCPKPLWSTPPVHTRISLSLAACHGQKGQSASPSWCRHFLLCKTRCVSPVGEKRLDSSVDTCKPSSASPHKMSATFSSSENKSSDVPSTSRFSRASSNARREAVEAQEEESSSKSFTRIKDVDAGNVVGGCGTPCLGPVTQAGCDALCPSYHRGCFGCYGPKEGANPTSLNTAWRALGASEDELQRVYHTFNAWAEPFRSAVQQSENEDKGETA